MPAQSTVRAAVLLVTPSAEAVMLVVPGRSPVARPLASIMATVELLEAHVKDTPVTGVPPLSKAVA
jgi:hypothetical protein